MAAVPFKVKALYDYTSREPDDLSFPIGQVIEVKEVVDADWYEGEYTDVTTGVKKARYLKVGGMFPNNYVERYEPEVPSRPSRPSRPVKETQPAVSSLAVAPQPNDELAEADAPSVASPSKPPQTQQAQTHQTQQAQMQQAQTQQTQPREVPAAPQAEPAAASTIDSKKAPAVAPKSNAFKDRIAAFNAPAAAPILPFTPGKRSQPSTFIKKPFVAPPPSKDAYIPPPKQDVVHKPYMREEDPEIRQRREEDHAAAQSAGLTNEDNQEDAEDAPKPQSLKDRIALLQRQQQEQAQRRVDSGPKKEKARPSAATEDVVEGEDLEQTRSGEMSGRPSLENRERPQIPTSSRPQETTVSQSPAIPQHEILSGGEEADQSEAGETTEDDDGTLHESDEQKLPAVHHRDDIEAPEDEDTAHEEPGGAGTAVNVEGDDDLDEDARRKLELRERMAKMSGGMGMAGMFGPAGGMPMPGMAASKKAAPREKRSTDDSTISSSPPVPQARMPMVPIPGLQRVMSPEREDSQDLGDDKDLPIRQRSQDESTAGRRSMTETRGAPPPLPNGMCPSTDDMNDNLTALDRPVPPTPARSQPPSSRPVPATPVVMPETPGSESDDEATFVPQHNTASLETPLPARSVAASQDNRISYFGSEGSVSTIDNRHSRVPPIPTGATSTSSRPPPPPPPAAIDELRRDDDRGESEYEGDYDTDIASSAKRKDALKSHTRDASYDGSTTADETSLSSPRALPPVPTAASRAAPPPPPAGQSQPKPSRQSTETPRAPPPIPPSRSATGDDQDYDPYRYVHNGPPPVPLATPAVPAPPSRDDERDDDSSDDLYSAPAPRKSLDRPVPPPGQVALQDRVPPPPPARDLQPLPRTSNRQSLDARRSIEQGRPSGEHGQIANNIELSQDSPWWTAPEPLPPVLQGRNGVDLIFESEKSTTSKRGGKTTVNKDIYILFHDYSQTIITARYDSREPFDVSLEQRHEPAPAKMRQDQLEDYWNRYGRRIADNANDMGGAKKEATVGDGSATNLVYELVKEQPQALLPVGTRAYGALVYANLANASVMQFDEIRPGDIVTLRNAKFEGKHSGPMHQKYKQDLGPSHVAVVNEWDGTKKKIRVWEQGREKKPGLKSESYRLADLKSGEVRVWRVVDRAWVSWESNAA